MMSCTVRAMASGFRSSGRPWSYIVHVKSAPDMLGSVAVASSAARRGAPIAATDCRMASSRSARRRCRTSRHTGLRVVVSARVSGHF